MGYRGSNRWCGATRPLSIFESSTLKLSGLTPSGGGILPSDRYGGGRGSMGLTGDDLWDVSQRGIAKLQVN
jgi:hypothetical protein